MTKTYKYIIALFVFTFGLMSTGAFVASGTVHASGLTRASAAKIIATGERFMGRPYKFGARTGNTSSFDCSSFTQYVYRVNGVSIPRTSRAQSRAGIYVSRRNLKPGDLVFFYRPIHHVAIYIGHGKILQTYGKPGVTISNLNSRWWSRHYTTARRVIRNTSYSARRAHRTSRPAVSSGSTAVIVHAVNFRTRPSLRGRRIRFLHRNEHVRILSKVNAYWYKIRDRYGRVGYVTTMRRYIHA